MLGEQAEAKKTFYFGFHPIEKCVIVMAAGESCLETSFVTDGVSIVSVKSDLF